MIEAEEKLKDLIGFMNDYIETLKTNRFYESDDYTRGMKIGQVGLIKTITDMLAEDK